MAKKDNEKKGKGKASSMPFGVKNMGSVANKCTKVPGNFGTPAKKGKK